MVDISIVNGIIKQLITEGHHLVEPTILVMVETAHIASSVALRPRIAVRLAGTSLRLESEEFQRVPARLTAEGEAGKTDWMVVEFLLRSGSFFADMAMDQYL